MSPWHAGEVALQRAAGVDARMAEIGPRVIRDHLPAHHREFFEQLPMLVVGSVDGGQRPWASILTGWPGFIATPDAQHLRIDALPSAHDPLRAQLQVGATLGLLGIEAETRRRNRANGRVTGIDGHGFDLNVDQSFGNCPQHIRPRTARWVGDAAGDESVAASAQRAGTRLSAEAIALIRAADTFFIASAAPGQGADVSHRGGPAGFVEVDDDEAGTRLSWPEYRGNLFFNTLGNLALHPFAGLLFVDHATGSVLQLSGRARFVDGEARRVHVQVGSSLWTPNALPLRWSD